MDEARFGFGKNWRNFLSAISEERVKAAERTLQEMLGLDDFHGRRFPDIGSGSGLFSLAARRLGAEVYSFDYDEDSVTCTRTLKQAHRPDDAGWTVQQGDILDQDYVSQLDQYDIVYSWGVLHHTGVMWKAIDNAARLVGPGGQLFIAIYNDQGWISHYWLTVKRLWNASALPRPAILLLHAPYLYFGRALLRFVRAKGRLDRGMSLWYDMIDWLGGLPFEVAQAEEVINFAINRSFEVRKLKTCGKRHGCNEFVFERRAHG